MEGWQTSGGQLSWSSWLYRLNSEPPVALQDAEDCVVVSFILIFTVVTQV